MADKAKVIKGLECCELYNKDNCDECPYDYNGRGNWKSECTAELATDARSILKDQEPKEPIRLHHTEHKQTDNYRCQKCGNDLYFEQRFCEECGCEVKWNE